MKNIVVAAYGTLIGSFLAFVLVFVMTPVVINVPTEEHRDHYHYRVGPGYEYRSAPMPFPIARAVGRSSDGEWILVESGRTQRMFVRSSFVHGLIPLLPVANTPVSEDPYVSINCSASNFQGSGIVNLIVIYQSGEGQEVSFSLSPVKGDSRNDKTNGIYYFDPEEVRYGLTIYLNGAVIRHINYDGAYESWSRGCYPGSKTIEIPPPAPKPNFNDGINA